MGGTNLFFIPIILLCYRVGRASYVKQEQYLQNVDAGAYGVATWVHAITDVIKNTKL